MTFRKRRCKSASVPRVRDDRQFATDLTDSEFFAAYPAAGFRVVQAKRPEIKTCRSQRPHKGRYVPVRIARRGSEMSIVGYVPHDSIGMLNAAPDRALVRIFESRLPPKDWLLAALGSGGRP
jgi:hypothetical protein